MNQNPELFETSGAMLDKANMLVQEQKRLIEAGIEGEPLDVLDDRVTKLRYASMMVSTAKHMYEKARIYLIQNHAFYGSMLCQLKIMWSPDVYLGATDGVSLVINPAKLIHCSEHEVRALLVHEIMHIAHLHPFRFAPERFNGAIEQDVANIACDLVINEIIYKGDDDLTLHESACLSEEYFDQSPESIYKILIQRIRKQKQQQGEGDGSGKGDNRCSTCGSDKGDQENGQSGDGSGQQPKDGKDRCPECGTPKNEDGRKGLAPGTQTGDDLRELSIDPDWLHGDILNPPPMGPAERADIEAQIKRMAHEAAFHARQMGQDLNTSANVTRAHRPRTNWVLALQSFVENAIEKDDYTWSRPRRRYVPFEMYLPDLGGTKPPKAVAVAVDVSGSIDERLLKKFLEELTALVYENHNLTFHIYAVDTAIKSKFTVGIEDMPIKWNVRAGGGTDFRPPFRDIEANDIPVSGLVYFTDMYCYDYPSKEPPYSVMWLNYGGIEYEEDGTPMGGQYSNYQPPFGRVVNMREEL